MVAEQARHLVRRLEVALGIGEQQRGRLVDPHMLADAGQHVLQRPPVGMMVVDVVGRQRLDPGSKRELGQAREPRGIVAGMAVGEGQIEIAPPVLPQPDGQLGEGRIRRLGRQQCQHLPGTVGQHVVQRQRAAALGRQPLAVGEQRAEPGIGRLVGRPAQERGAVHQIEPAADQEAEAAGLGLRMRPHDAGQAVAVGERQAGEPQRLRLHDQLLRVRGAAQEAEIGGGLQLGIAHGLGIAGHGHRRRRYVPALFRKAHARRRGDDRGAPPTVLASTAPDGRRPARG